MNEKYLFLCFGRSYIDDSLDLVQTLRKHGDTRAVDIVVLPNDANYAQSQGIFDRIVTFSPDADPLFNHCKTSFEKYCLLPRLRIESFLSADFTMILDVDMLCAFSTESVWEFCKSFLDKHSQPVVMLGAKHNTIWHWGKWGEICRKLDTEPFETHGGFFFFKKDERLKSFFHEAEKAFVNYSAFGMKKMFRSGAVDEPLFAYSFSKNGFVPAEFSEHSIMTFNLSPRDEIPSRKLTEQRQARIMKDYIPFIHMFAKNKSRVFISLKEKILNSNAQIHF